MSLSSLNPFNSDEEPVAKAENATASSQARINDVDPNTLQTELDEMEMLTGERPRLSSFKRTEIQDPIDSPIEKPITIAENVTESIEEIKDDIEPVFEESVIESEVAEKPVDITPPETIKKATNPEAKQPIIKPATGCPAIEIIPTAKSITNFEKNMSGQMTSRASISDVRGGCEVVNGGMEIDLDILMNGTITNKGRFEGKTNEEAFVAFPYFVSVIKPDGSPIDKKIMATAMRFRPSVNYIDHAEKITQFVPMDDVLNSANYKITVGYQLTRKQFEYNTLENAARPNDIRVSPDTIPATRRSVNPLGSE